MVNKDVGRNDPCPCGSGKKYKACCWSKTLPKRKFTAKLLNTPNSIMARTFGNTAQQSNPNEQKPLEEK